MAKAGHGRSREREGGEGGVFRGEVEERGQKEGGEVMKRRREEASKGESRRVSSKGRCSKEEGFEKGFQGREGPKERSPVEKRRGPKGGGG